MNNFLQSIKNLSPGRLASIVAIFIFLISFFIYIAMQMGNAEYGVLYTDLELEDAKQIVTRLESANVKYRLAKNGTEILVPKDLVNKMRVDTAELALASKGSNVGYEIFDNADALGTTNFVQNVNLVRALEGELGSHDSFRRQHQERPGASGDAQARDVFPRRTGTDRFGGHQDLSWQA